MSVCLSLDTCRFMDAVVPILQEGRHKPTVVIEALILLVLQAVQKLLPHLGNPGQTFLHLLQEHVVGVGSVSTSCDVSQEVLNTLFVLWPKWGIQRTEDGLILNLSKVICQTLEERPQKFVRGIVKTIFTRLDRAELAQMVSFNVHKSFRTLLLHYHSFTLEQFQAIILGCGLMEEVVNQSADYLQEGVPEMLLFAAQEFASSSPVDAEHGKSKMQWDMWTLLSLLCQQNRDVSATLYNNGALDVVTSVLKSPKVERAPVYRFLTSLMIGNQTIKAQMLQSAEIMFDANKTLNEGALADFVDPSVIAAGDFFASFTEKITFELSSQIVQLQVMEPLMQAACQHPQLLAERALHCVRNLAVIGSDRTEGHRRHEGNAVSAEAARKELEEKVAPETIFEASFKQGYYKLFEHVLNNTAISDASLLSLLYTALTTFFYHCPLRISHVWCTEEFVKNTMTAAERHVSQFNETSVQAAIASCVSSITYNCLTDVGATERLHEAGVHESTVRCLEHVLSPSILPKWLMTYSNLIYCYRIHLKNLKCFFDCRGDEVLLSVAKRHGESVRVGEELDRCLLNWTYDKESSDRFGKEGFTVALIPLLDRKYAYPLRRAVIHAIGNIAISSQTAKLSLVKADLHTILMKEIGEVGQQRQPTTYLSACCRLLHIVAASDDAKIMLIRQNCLQAMMDLVRRHRGEQELEWRPLGVISALCFLPVACRHHVCSQEIFAFLSQLLKSAKQARVLAYASLVLIALAEDDESLVQVSQLDLEEILQSGADDPANKASFSDISRWANIVVEKVMLHTVKLPGSLYSKLQIPPLPDLSSGCSASLEECKGHISATKERFSPFTPQAPELNQDQSSQLIALGRNPYKVFRIGRVFGSSHGLCSNCDKDSPSSEFVFRPHGVTPTHYQELIDQGWYRRGGVKMFRFRDVHSMECCDWETRVRVSEFKLKSRKSFQKVWRRMPKADRLVVTRRSAYFNQEAYELYNAYHVGRYDKPPKSEHSYIEHVVNTPLGQQAGRGCTYGTFHDEYRLDGKLVAVSVLDIIPKGMVSVYMWYDLAKEVCKYSFGVYSALKEITDVQKRNEHDPTVEYYYLQGWNECNRRLKYKGDYEPEDFYAPCITDRWVSTKDGVSAEKAIKLEARKKTGPLDPSPSQPGEASTSANPQPKETANSTDLPPSAQEVAFHPLAMENDKQLYAREFGDLCVDNLTVCVNHSMYLTFRELKAKIPFRQAQREMMERRFEELMLAVGGALASQMVVDVVVIPY